MKTDEDKHGKRRHSVVKSWLALTADMGTEEAPDQIWLQWSSSDPYEITWCQDQIDESDVRYVRADIADGRYAAGLEAAADLLDQWWRTERPTATTCAARIRALTEEGEDE